MSNRKQRRHPTHHAVLPIQPSSEKLVVKKTGKTNAKGFKPKTRRK